MMFLSITKTFKDTNITKKLPTHVKQARQTPDLVREMNQRLCGPWNKTNMTRNGKQPGAADHQGSPPFPFPDWSLLLEHT